MFVTKEKAKQNALQHFENDELKANIWLSKYCMNDGERYEASPAATYRRLAKEFAKYDDVLLFAKSKEEAEEVIYNAFVNYEIMPQGSPTSAIGNIFQIESASNCYVIDGPHDSYESIMDTDNKLAQLCKRRGGVGFNLDRIRPKNLPVKNAARTSTGVVPFAERYSRTTGEVAQNGRRKQ